MKTKPTSKNKTRFSYLDEYDFWKLWRRSSHLMVRARDIEVRPFRVSPIQAGVLMFLKEYAEPCTPTDIARWLMREPHAVTQLLDRMEKQELVSTNKDSKRKNLVRVKITE